MNKKVGRRRFLQASAAGGAALALSDAGRAVAAPPRDAVTLEFWNPGNDPLGGPIIVKLVNEFNAKVGKQLGIFVRNRPISANNNYVKYTTAMTSSGSPDVIMTYGYDPVIPWIANGFVVPLDGYAKQLGMKQGDFYPLAWQMVNFNGRIWGFMQEFDMTRFYWNKSIHAGPPPKTFAEMDALAAKYTKFDKKGNLVQAGLIPWAEGGFSPGGYGTWGTIWGARFYDFDKNKWTINTPQNRKYLEWYLKYVDMFGGRAKADALISAVPRTYGDVFLYGKTAFAMEGEFIPLELGAIGIKDLKYGIAGPPIVPGVTKKATNMVDAANVFLLPVRAKHSEAAATFIKYMVSTQALVAWSKPIGQMLPTKAAANDPGLLHSLPWMKLYNEAVEGGEVLPPPLSVQLPVFNKEISTATDEVTYKRKSPADALAAVEQKVMAEVQRFKQFHPSWTAE